jgi:hypothetical protein
MLLASVDVSLVMKFLTNPLAPVPWGPVLLVGALFGVYGGLQIVKSKVPNVYKIFEAKQFKNGIPLLIKPYKYGVVLETDGSGTARAKRLHMHNKNDKMFFDERTKRPSIVNRKNIEYGIPEMRIDGVPVTEISTLDQVEATHIEKRAATMFMEKARQYEDRDGKRVFKYPVLNSIPSKEANKISDMVYAIDDDELEALARSYTHIDKNFMVQDTIKTPVLNEAGEQVKDADGNQVYEERLAFDEEGRPIYRKPNQNEIQEWLRTRAGHMAAESRRLREEVAQTYVTGGITVHDCLYSIVTRPWMDEEVDVIDTQNEQAKHDEKKDKKQQDARVDNTVIIMVGGALAVLIICVALKYILGVF